MRYQIVVRFRLFRKGSLNLFLKSKLLFLLLYLLSKLIFIINFTGCYKSIVTGTLLCNIPTPRVFFHYQGYILKPKVKYLKYQKSFFLTQHFTLTQRGQWILRLAFC